MIFLDGAATGAGAMALLVVTLYGLLARWQDRTGAMPRATCPQCGEPLTRAEHGDSK